MKRIFSFALLAMVCTLGFAAKHITLESGSVAALNKLGVRIFMEYDYSDFLIYDAETNQVVKEDDFLKKMGGTWVANKGKDIPMAEASFTESFNEESDRITAVMDKSMADYIVVYKLNLFSYGTFKPAINNNVKGFAAGTFTIIESSSKKVVAKLSTTRIYGSVFASTWAMKKEYVYDNVAEELAEFLNDD
ncbi:MAG: hypothetical protein K6E54_00220 [Bacteroidaceae bacterium]|nr:hypothetical protein [Bacteroidaceae bacterium]